MTDPLGYVLGQTDRAARRLLIQDAHFAEASEKLLDDLALRPDDRVVELGCGPGGFTRRVVRRLGPAGVVVGVDAAQPLLDRAAELLAGEGPGRFEAVRADIAEPGPWLDGATVVVGRAVLHHVPMAEYLVGRLRGRVAAGTRVGFIEPDFRTPLARLAALEAGGRADLAPLRVWATAINQLYAARRISPAVGATLAGAMAACGFRRVAAAWHEVPSDAVMIENMVMFYDEVRGPLAALGILSAAEVDAEQRTLQTLPPAALPPVWGVHRVSAEA